MRAPGLLSYSAQRILGRLSLSQCTNAFRKFILRKQFQISLPLSRITIMLRGNWRLPGGRQPPKHRELPS
jgi:hypothetical protein